MGNFVGWRTTRASLGRIWIFSENDAPRTDGHVFDCFCIFAHIGRENIGPIDFNEHFQFAVVIYFAFPGKHGAGKALSAWHMTSNLIAVMIWQARPASINYCRWALSVLAANLRLKTVEEGWRRIESKKILGILRDFVFLRINFHWSSMIILLSFIISDFLSVRLRDGALVCAGPPCSLFIGASSSVHMRRDWRLEGNTGVFKVRLANRIWQKFVSWNIVQHFLNVLFNFFDFFILFLVFLKKNVFFVSIFCPVWFQNLGRSHENPLAFAPEDFLDCGAACPELGIQTALHESIGRAWLHASWFGNCGIIFGIWVSLSLIHYRIRVARSNSSL